MNAVSSATLLIPSRSKSNKFIGIILVELKSHPPYSPKSVVWVSQSECDTALTAWRAGTCVCHSISPWPLLEAGHAGPVHRVFMECSRTNVSPYSHN